MRSPPVTHLGRIALGSCLVLTVTFNRPSRSCWAMIRSCDGLRYMYLFWVLIFMSVIDGQLDSPIASSLWYDNGLAGGVAYSDIRAALSIHANQCIHPRVEIGVSHKTSTSVYESIFLLQIADSYHQRWRSYLHHCPSGGRNYGFFFDI